MLVEQSAAGGIHHSHGTHSGLTPAGQKIQEWSRWNLHHMSKLVPLEGYETPVEA